MRGSGSRRPGSFFALVAVGLCRHLAVGFSCSLGDGASHPSHPPGPAWGYAGRRARKRARGGGGTGDFLGRGPLHKRGISEMVAGCRKRLCEFGVALPPLSFHTPCFIVSIPFAVSLHRGRVVHSPPVLGHRRDVVPVVLSSFRAVGVLFVHW